MIDYIQCNLEYYRHGNGKGSAKYSNAFKIILYSVIEYIDYLKSKDKPIDELQLKRRQKRNKNRLKIM